MSALDESDANRVSVEVHAKSTGFQTQRGLHNLRSSYSRLLTPRRVFLLKLRIFTFLDHPIGLIQSSYHVTIFFLMLTVYGLSILDTIKEIHDSVVWYVYAYMELLLVSIYLMEYLLRIWSCDVMDQFHKSPRIKYMLKPTMLIDLLILMISIPSVIVALMNRPKNSLTVLILNFLQIIRLFRSERHFGTVSMMLKVLRNHRKELATGYCCGLLFIIFTASLVYMAEKNNSKSSVKTFSDSIYFIFISFLTIGYGDIVPSTAISKIIIVTLAMMGIGFVAVPSGIIGSGFAIQAAHRSKKNKRRQTMKPAVSLIQSALRNYFYQHADSAVVKQDLKSVIRSSKIAETFLKACSLTSKNDVTEQPRVDQQFYFTISSSAEGDKIRSRLKQKLAKTNVGHKKHGSALTNESTERLNKLVKVCFRFIRALQLDVKVSKFKKATHPGCLDEIIQAIETDQQKFSFQLLEIMQNIEHMKLDSMSLKPSHSVDTKAHSLASDTFSAPTCTLHQAQLKELHQKLDNLNHIVDNAIQKLTQQKK